MADDMNPPSFRLPATGGGKTNAPPERLIETGDGLTEFAPEHKGDPSLILRTAVESRGGAIPRDAILGLDERTRVPESRWKGLTRGLALIGAGLAIGAVGIVVLQTLLRPTPIAAIEPPAVVAPAAPHSLNTPGPPRVAPPEAAAVVAAAPSSYLPDERVIELVLDRYRDTFNGLDAKALDRTENQQVSFDRCHIEIGGDHAEAVCLGTARYVPRVGKGEPRIEARRWRFTLHQERSRDWVVDEVEER